VIEEKVSGGFDNPISVFEHVAIGVVAEARVTGALAPRLAWWKAASAKPIAVAGECALRQLTFETTRCRSSTVTID
jgi:hypothetical protein